MYFVCASDNELGGGVIMAVVAHTKMLKVRRYAQVAKHIWQPFKGNKHHHIVKGFFVMPIVWVHYDNVLSVSITLSL